jgi:hypothetical protein
MAEMDELVRAYKRGLISEAQFQKARSTLLNAQRGIAPRDEDMVLDAYKRPLSDRDRWILNEYGPNPSWYSMPDESWKEGTSPVPFGEINKMVQLQNPHMNGGMAWVPRDSDNPYGPQREGTNAEAMARTAPFGSKSAPYFFEPRAFSEDAAKMDALRWMISP